MHPAAFVHCCFRPRANRSLDPPRGLRVCCGVLAAVLLLLFLPALARADLVPERRRDYDSRPPNEYLVIPAVASLPGFGVFVGVIASGSNLLDSGMNVGAGGAESISGSDIHLQAIAFQEIPIWQRTLTFDYQFADIKLGNLQGRVPGRDAPNFTYPITQEFFFQLVRPTLRLWERRITVAYSLGYVNGFNVDENGNEITSRNHSSSASLALDFTDDVVNPVKGARLSYQTSLTPPTSSFFGTNSGNARNLLASRSANITREQYELTCYVPVLERWDLVGDIQYFQAVGNSDGSIVTGGSLQLRGFPGSRWSDRYGVMGALEARYTIPVFRRLEIPYLAHGIIEGLQLAGFYEQGQVSPTRDHSLFTSMHSDFGAGVRIILESVVVRFDVAHSDEATTTALTINQPF